MSGIFLALALIEGVLIVAVFISALSCYSLRSFSRSRLEEICRFHSQNERFGTILKHHEHATLAWELVLLWGLIAAVFVAILWLKLIPADAADRLPGWEIEAGGRFFLIIVALAFSAVILPWSVARVGGETFLFHWWPVTYRLLSIVQPLIWLCGSFDTIVHRLTGQLEPEEGDAANITDEIRTVVDEGQRKGVLESEAGTMIRRVMELQEADVADIMVPRIDMTCIHVDSTLQEARERLLKAGHSRIPIIGESADDVVGILYAKDLLKQFNSSGGSSVSLRDIGREPFYVPETTGIDTLLQMMKNQRVHLAIVLDEYGGVAGLVTMEDILEEIVGEIVDEYDSAVVEQFIPVAAGITEVDARVHVDDVNERLGLELPTDRDYDTIGGFAFSVLGRIPVAGENFQWGPARFTILEADKRKLTRLRIEVDKSVSAVPPD